VQFNARVNFENRNPTCSKSGTPAAAPDGFCRERSLPLLHWQLMVALLNWFPIDLIPPACIK
jgi:hypothetical protein